MASMRILGSRLSRLEENGPDGPRRAPERVSRDLWGNARSPDMSPADWAAGSARLAGSSSGHMLTTTQRWVTGISATLQYGLSHT
jgi:hypothetical protein